MIKQLSVEIKHSHKFKKNVCETVNLDKESKKDPKYKTELCKSWEKKGSCLYFNKCRFAHGRHELFVKGNNNTKYKLKQCLSFDQNGFCLYGTRCHFKHNEANFSEMERSFYSFLLDIYKISNENLVKNINNNHVLVENTNNCFDSANFNSIKYQSFSNLCQSNESMSTLSNDSYLKSFIAGKRRRLCVFTDISSKSACKSINDSFDNHSPINFKNFKAFIPLMCDY